MFVSLKFHGQEVMNNITMRPSITVNIAQRMIESKAMGMRNVMVLFALAECTIYELNGAHVQ